MKTVLYLFYLVLFTQYTLAYHTSLYELEPNNTPTNATAFSGETILRGTISKDDQDAFMWKVNEKDSQYSWDIELKGVPNALTRIDIIKVTFTKDGKKVENYKKFFSFGTRTGLKPVYLKNLLVEEGEYLIALSSKSEKIQNEEKSYKIIFTKKRETRLQKREEKKHAIKLSDDYYPYLIKENTGWFYFDINQEGSKKVWTLQGSTTIGHTLDVLLTDESNHTIAEATTDKYGKYIWSDLELDEGKYYLRYSTNAKGIKSTIALYSTGAIKIDKHEVEPNDDKKNANLIKYNKIIHGSVDEKDKHDFYIFSLPEKLKDKVLDISLEGNLSNMTFLLFDEREMELQKKTKDSNCTMTDLMLDSSKNYMLEVQGNKNFTEYTITFSNIRDYNSSKEVEPNDSKETSFSIETKHTLHGYFKGDEWDCFNFNIDKFNRIWEVTVAGEKLHELWLLKGQDTTLLDIREKYNNEMHIKNLLLLPGLYKSCIRGINGGYTFSVHEDTNATLLGKDIEHEPNQNESQTNTLHFGQTIHGVLESKDNEDYFHFTLKNHEHIRLTATPPKDGDSRIKLISSGATYRSYPEIGKISVIEGTYPPGRYVIDLWSEKPSYGMYSLKLERLNPFIASTDKEPNQYLNIDKLPETHIIKGHTSRDDEDAYSFSKEIKEANITISGENLQGNIRIYPSFGSGVSQLPLVWNEENKTYTTTLKKSEEDDLAHMVVNSGIGYYDYNLSFSGHAPKIHKELDISLAINIENTEVAAYSEYGQKVKFSVELESHEDYDLNISYHLSDADWSLDFEKNITIQSAEKKTIPFALVIPKNIAEIPTIITIKFSNPYGDFKTVDFEMKPKNSAPVINAYIAWNVPKSLVGGLNLARTALGAEIIKENNTSASDIEKLFDGLIYKDRTFSFDRFSKYRKKDENVTIKLATNKGALIVGTCLNTLGGHYEDLLKEFTLWLSMDGKTFTKVLNSEHNKPYMQQCFTLSSPQKARYARLTLHTNQRNEKTRYISLGEWKVIAEPKNATPKEPINLANKALGGHVIWSTRYLSRDWDVHMLMPNKQTYKYGAKIGEREIPKDEKALSFVVGFKNERVAKLTHINWQESEKSTAQNRLGNTLIEVSTQTPFGPWEKAGMWERNATLDQNQTQFEFKAPVYARYVKLTSTYPKGRYFYPPEILSVYEAYPSNDYYSILGEWNAKSHRSFYESTIQKKRQDIEYISGNESKNKSFKMENNQSVTGSVSVASNEEDWYTIEVKEGNNTLSLYLEGKDSVDASLMLYDKNDTKITPNLNKKPTRHTYNYSLLPGKYTLKVYQPLINVVFAWDHSGSVSPYSSQIASSVHHYVNTIKKGVDAVNLLCFNSPDVMLLSTFRDEVDVVQRVFSDFNWRCDGSNASHALKSATNALKGQMGIKGVIIIGDADGDRDIKLWPALKKVKPKVFSIRVESSYDEGKFEGVMQSWTRVNNGDYSVVENTSEMTEAINRAMYILRQPVSYTLKAKSLYTRPLGDGALEIVLPKDSKKKVIKNLAIELILDASGSMLKRIKGKRRISIAKDVLKKAVTDIIPKGTLVALRVFGHKEADSCRTDLEMQLQSLNVSKTTKIISKIKAKNLAKTPIADSLAKVADDLSKVKGKKVVILVTDGKETCNGNPAKVIQMLKEKGVDVRINIVGFAINDQELKEQFKEWARLGDGSYFDASDKESLAQAVKKALQIPYKVYNNKEKLVTKGIVDSNSVRLKGGIYKVIIESSPPQTIEDVVITGEQTRTLTLTEEKEK